MKTGITILPILAATILSLSCNDESDNASGHKIKLGLIGSASAYPGFTEVFRQSAYLAIAEINDAGGIVIGNVAYQLELITMDDELNPTNGIAKAAELKDQGVSFLLGPTTSSVTLGETIQYHPDIIDGIADFAIANDMLMMLFSATSADITTLDDNSLVWRTCPSDVFQGRVAAEYIFNNAQFSTAGIIYRDDPWGRGLSQSFTEHFEDIGGDVQFSLPYTVLENDEGYDFTSIVLEALKTQPQVVYLLSFGKDGAKFTEDFAQGTATAPYHPFIFATEAINEYTILENGNINIVLGMQGTAVASPNNNPGWHQFVSNYQNAYNEPPLTYSAFVYDSVYLIGYALQTAGVISALQARQHLEDISNYNEGDLSIGVNAFAKGRAAIENDQGINYSGASGPIAFDANGDPGRATYTIWRVDNDNGTLVFTNLEQVEYP